MSLVVSAPVLNMLYNRQSFECGVKVVSKFRYFFLYLFSINSFLYSVARRSSLVQSAGTISGSSETQFSFLFSLSLSLSFAHFAVKVYMLGHLQIMDVNLPIMVQLSNY